MSTVGYRPDYGPAKSFFSENAKLLKELGLDSLDWGKEQWASQQELLDRILQTQEGIAESRLGAAEDWQRRYEESFVPLEQQLVRDAETFSTQARQDQEAAARMGDVGRAFEAQRNQAQKRLESYGIDPSNTRAQALDAAVRTQEAVAKVQAANEGRRYVEDKARELRNQAINLGQANVGQATRGYLDAANVGSGVLQNQLAGLTGGQQLMQQSALPWLDATGRAYTGALNIDQQRFQNEVARQQMKNAGKTDWMGGAGMLAGIAAAPFTGGASLALPTFAGGMGGGTPTTPMQAIPNTPSMMGAPAGWGNPGVPGYADGGYVGPTNYDDNYASGVATKSAQRQMGPGINFAAGIPIGYACGGKAGYAYGGEVDGWTNVGTQDGEIRGIGGPKDDLIDAKLSDGEYVIPAEVVRRKGTEFFDKMIEKTKGAIPQAVAAGAAMVTTPPGGSGMGGADGAIPMMNMGGYIQKGVAYGR